MRQLVLSVTKDQFNWQFFRAGGAGGQNQNKRDSACRCIHPPSNAVGVARDERSQSQNRKLAFKRCVATKEFQQWLRIQTSRNVAITEREIQASVDAAMHPSNIKEEYYTPID